MLVLVHTKKSYMNRFDELLTYVPTSLGKICKESKFACLSLTSLQVTVTIIPNTYEFRDFCQLVGRSETPLHVACDDCA